MTVLSGREKATVLLAIIGPQKAAHLLRRLPEEVADLLAAKVAALPRPSTSDVNVLWSELSRNILEAPKIVKSLAASESSEFDSKPEEFVERGTPTERLNAMIPIKIVEILKNEKTRVQRFALTLFTEAKSREVMNILDYNKKKQVENLQLDEFVFLDEIKPVVVDAILNYYEDPNGNN